MKRVLVFALLSGLAPVLAGCQPSWVMASEDRLVRFFRDLTYGEDFSRKFTYERLRKWTVPLKVAIFGNDTPEDRQEIEAQLRLVSRLTGLPWKMVDRPSDDVNLVFWFLPDQEFRVHGEFVPCYALIGGSNGIVTVRITISTLFPRGTVRCISHELMHAMGFPKHSGVLPSVTSPLHREERPTEWDRLALRILYDDRLRPGMTEKEASPVFRRVIRGIWRTRS